MSELVPSECCLPKKAVKIKTGTGSRARHSADSGLISLANILLFEIKLELNLKLFDDRERMDLLALPSVDRSSLVALT